MDPATTELQVLTEFFDSTIEAHQVRNHEGPDDTYLRIGPMHFGEGSAFGEDTETEIQRKESVRKDWIEMDGRHFLIESVPLVRSQSELDSLPKEGAWKSRPSSRIGTQVPMRMTTSTESMTWKQSVAALIGSGTRQTASLSVEKIPGYVVDYLVVSTTANQTFSSTNTYYVTGPVTLSGTVTFEPMTVIKYANTNNSELAIHTSASLIWKGESYRPVFFTAKDDNSVGQTLPGSTGSPSGTYANLALSLPGLNTAAGRSIRDLRISYAKTAIRATYGNSKHLIRHAQFFKCDQGVTSKNALVEMQNVLMAEVKTNFANLESSTVRVYFATLDIGNKLNDNPDASVVEFFAVLCTSVANTSGVTFDGGVQPSSSNSGFYRTAVAGRYYLLPGGAVYTNSLYKWYGDLPSELLDDAEDQSLTDMAPPIVSGNMVASLAQTNMVTPFQSIGLSHYRCGYRYPRLDLIVSNLVVGSGYVLKILNPAQKVGLAGGTAFQLSGGEVQIQGSPQNHITLYRVASLQENSSESTVTNSTFYLVGGNQQSGTFRMVDIELIPSEIYTRRQLLNSGIAVDGVLKFQDCRLRGLNIEPYYMGVSSGFALLMYNNIVESSRVSIGQTSSGSPPPFHFQFYNNLVRWSAFSGSWNSGAMGDWNIRDCLFESCLINSSGTLPSSNNAFYQSAMLPGSGNISVSTLNWAGGTLGSYYYGLSGGVGSLTSLINAGSRSAASSGLYHLTTRADYVKDGVNGSVVDIGFHYTADLVDWDGDSFSLSDEALNGSDPLSYDTDGDGVLDNDEYWAGTNPRSVADIPAQRLDHWSFDSGLESDNGASPISNSSTFVESYSGRSVCFTNSTAKITYPTEVSVGGTNRPTISFWNGTIRLSYVSDWGVNGNSAFPNQWVRLIECGNWKLSINADASRLVFQSPTLSGGSRTNIELYLPVNDFPGPRKYMEITLSYGPGISKMRVRNAYTYLTLSQNYQTGPGVEVDVSAAEKSLGWTLGNATSGGLPALGCIDEFETFKCLADPEWQDRSNVRFARFYDTVRRQSSALSATGLSGGIGLKWVRGWEGDWSTNSQLYGISRRIAGTSSAFTSIATGVRTNSWQDTSAVAGVYYEYRIDRHPSVPLTEHPTIVAARDGAPIDYRGRAILIIDQTLTNLLWSDFEAYKRQLAADGWRVTNYFVPRHFDSPLVNCAAFDADAISGQRANTNNMELVKGYIRREYTNNINATNVVILLGHVPIPFSGTLTEDGHAVCSSATNSADHRGAWVTDSWYGDMTEQWTDSVTQTNCDLCNHSNLPADGKFDQNIVPLESDGSLGKIEVPISRIDFSNLPVYFDSLSVSTGSQVEQKLFQRYFSKTLRYRKNQTGFVRDVRSFQGNGAFHGMIQAHQYLGARLSGNERFEKHYQGEDLFLASTNYLWGLHGDYGDFAGIGYNQYPVTRQHYSSEIVGPSEFPHAMFMFLDGSYMADWYFTDSIMRVALGLPDTALVLSWGRNHAWKTDRVNAGGPVCTVVQDTLSSGFTTSSRRNLLGDPTLREKYVNPVVGFIAAKSGANVVLNWTANSDATAGFRIYRSNSTNSLDWVLVGTAPSGSTSWTGTPTNPSTNSYMIKSAATLNSGSGSYSVLGLGVVLDSDVVFP